MGVEQTRFSSGFPNLSTYTLNPGRRSSSTYASCRLDASLQYARKTDIASVEIFTKETDIRDAISANPLNYGASRVFPATFTTRRFLSIPVSPPPPLLTVYRPRSITLENSPVRSISRNNFCRCESAPPRTTDKPGNNSFCTRTRRLFMARPHGTPDPIDYVKRT